MLICNHERSNEVLCPSVDVFISNRVFADNGGFVRFWKKLVNIDFRNGGNVDVGRGSVDQEKSRF